MICMEALSAFGEITHKRKRQANFHVRFKDAESAIALFTHQDPRSLGLGDDIKIARPQQNPFPDVDAAK
jgi:hypothetical protein